MDSWINLKIFLGYDITYLNIWPFMCHTWFPTRKASKLTFIYFQLAGWWPCDCFQLASWKQTNISFEAFLGMYFDAGVVFVTNSSLLIRLAVAILWCVALLKQPINRFHTVWQNSQQALKVYYRASPVMWGQCFTCNPRVSSLIPGASDLKRLLIWMKIHGLPKNHNKDAQVRW